jgi:hypothetical protein
VVRRTIFFPFVIQFTNQNAPARTASYLSQADEAIMKLATLLALVGALPLPARSAHLPDWRKPLTVAFFALHEARRRQAAREIGRHQHLLDRYARPPTPEQPPDQNDNKVASR